MISYQVIQQYPGRINLQTARHQGRTSRVQNNGDLFSDIWSLAVPRGGTLLLSQVINTLI